MNTKTISSKEEFGELFCRILKEKGISNYKMSEDLKGVIDISSLRLYAKGINFPRTRERLKILCDYLGINIDSIDIPSNPRQRRRLTRPGRLATPVDLGTNGKSLGGYAQDTDFEVTHAYSTSTTTSFSGYKINGEHGVIIGESPAMLRVFELLDNITNNPDQESVVLITGETGTGKELVARTVHYNGRRKTNPFVGINVKNVAETLLESELFGHRSGAFTDAKHDKAGFFETVGGGTLFLDEIGSIHSLAQAKLLRVLQEKSFYRVGDTNLRPFYGRIVVATKEDLEKLVKDGDFRDDLYYRLNVVRVTLPPLKDRGSDSLLLFGFFVDQHNRKYDTDYSLTPTQDGVTAIQEYNFPGNVRELENLITRAIFAHPKEHTIRIEDVTGSTNVIFAGSPKTDFINAVMANVIDIKDWEKLKVTRILDGYFTSGGNIAQCSRIVGINRTTISSYLARYGINLRDLRSHLKE